MEFYERFFRHVGGLSSITRTPTLSEYDELAEQKQSALEPVLDMLDYFVKVASGEAHYKTRTSAVSFVTFNGFGREKPYVVEGENRKRGRKEFEGKASVIAADTLQKYWDAAPKTIGLAYVLLRSWPEFWSLRIADADILQKLSEFSGDLDKIKEVFAQYNWLTECCQQEFRCRPEGGWNLKVA